MASRKPNRGRRKPDQLPRRLFKRPPDLAPSSDAPFSGIPPGAPIKYAPADYQKMSDVLKDYVAPFWAPELDEAGVRSLLNVAIMTWNTALLPEDKREAMLDKIIEEVFSRASAAEKVEVRGFLEALVERKLKHFAAIRRSIVSFALMDAGREYQLNVMSTLPIDGLAPEGPP